MQRVIYPKEHLPDKNSETNVVLVRPVSPEDEEGLRRMLSRLSRESVYLRFHAPLPRAPEWAVAMFANVDRRYGESLVAVADGEVVGHAMYVRQAGNDDWVEAARSAMVEGGIDAVAVEPLARRLGVTKGSFYWHFKARRALLEATLGRWEKESTDAVIATTRRVADPRERLVRLGEEPFRDDDGDEDAPGQGIFLRRAFELAVSDAVDDALVRPFLRRVIEHRIGYLEECYRALGFSPEEARHRALLVYTAHAGTFRLLRDAPDLMPSGKDYAAYRQHLFSTLMPKDEGG